MSVVTKAWGTTECLLATPLVELHRIHVLPGGYCSVHKHHGRANVFYVVAGELEVEVWADDPTPEFSAFLTQPLVAGEIYTVGPGSVHKFRSRRGAEVLELYYPVLRGEDIERFSEGGLL